MIFSGFRAKSQKRVTSVAFQSILQKQIRKLPKILKSFCENYSILLVFNTIHSCPEWGAPCRTSPFGATLWRVVPRLLAATVQRTGGGIERHLLHVSCAVSEASLSFRVHADGGRTAKKVTTYCGAGRRRCLDCARLRRWRAPAVRGRAPFRIHVLGLSLDITTGYPQDMDSKWIIVWKIPLAVWIAKKCWFRDVSRCFEYSNVLNG